MLPDCAIGCALLRKFCARIEALPTSVGIADESHPLAVFSGNPVGCVGEDENAWEKFDGPLNTLLQRPPDELQHLVRVGEKGLIALCHLLEYLVACHQVSGVLLEGKLGCDDDNVSENRDDGVDMYELEGHEGMLDNEHFI